MAVAWILVVDRSESDLHLVFWPLFKGERTETVTQSLTVQNALAALDCCQDLPKLPLVAERLPGMSELELLAKVQGDAKTSQIPIGFVSGDVQERDVVAALEQGANSYVRKVVDNDQMIRELNTTLIYWLDIHCTPYLERTG